MSLEIIKLLECKDEDKIDLNIGGKKISSTTKKITKLKSALGRIFSNNHNLLKDNGKILIDKDGKTFKLWIQYLRNDKIPNFEDENKNIKQSKNNKKENWILWNSFLLCRNI